MAISLSHPTQIVKGEIQLTSSKSESNRALIIRALCDDHFDINNLSISDDTTVLQKILNSESLEQNVGLAGTAMRFLTAFKAIQKGECVITGAARMKERPIKILVDVLKQLGADIEYTETEGFPPLKIVGKELEGGEITIDGSISSQYISALLMIAPKLKKGIRIQFSGEIISKPYINMTIEMMNYFGASVQWEGSAIYVNNKDYEIDSPLKKGARRLDEGVQSISRSKFSFDVEADWSAASYWYSIVALAKEADVTLYGLKKESLQGDSIVQHIYKNFGVETTFIDGGIRLVKVPGFQFPASGFEFDFSDCPDIAQTVAVTCAALNITTKLTGLKTLRIKETDRIAALQTELTNLDYDVEVDGDDLIIHSLTSLRGMKQSSSFENELTSLQSLSVDNLVKTYDDHRIAMAFAPLALINKISIEDENVVAKSYPNFWKDLEFVGFSVD